MKEITPITKNMMASKELRKAFSKEHGLPIKVYDDHYWDYYLELFNPFYGTIEKYTDFVKKVERFGNIGKYLQAKNEFIQKIINRLHENKHYQALLNDTSLPTHGPSNYSEFYTLKRSGKYYVSIDIVSANFNALRLYSPGIFEGAETWEQYIKNEDFTGPASKLLRQQILGMLNQKKISSLVGNLIKKIHDVLSPDFSDKIVSMNMDEIIIENSLPETYEKIVQLCEQFKDIVKVSSFKLVNIQNMKYFVKEGANGKIEFKCIPEKVFAQCIKKYLGLEVTKEDLTFMDEYGIPATYHKSIFE